MYIYEDHMGGLYVSHHMLSHEETYCEQCGDSDWLIGCAYTRQGAWDLLKTDSFFGYDYNYIKAFIDTYWAE
jgi:hypothetical protein